MHEKGDEANENKNLPDIIQFYNETKGGVDTMDQLCHTYSCSRKTRRWPLCLFYNLLNIIGINGMILLKGSNTREKEIIINRRLFLKELAMALSETAYDEPTEYSNFASSPPRNYMSRAENE